MTPQLQTWVGDFGRAYTDRNPVDWRSRRAAFADMLTGVQPRRVLEVGCNRGHNLVAIGDVLGPAVACHGVEPNPYALQVARQVAPHARLAHGTALDLPFANGAFDLVLTSCVLIHVHEADLPQALRELYRVSGRYLLSIEYFADRETTIHYRGHDDLLWKRDFLWHYELQFPDLRLVRQGDMGPADGFDDTRWWLLEKPRTDRRCEAEPR